MYRNSIKENTMETDNLEEIIEKLENIIHNATKESIPKYIKKTVELKELAVKYGMER